MKRKTIWLLILAGIGLHTTPVRAQYLPGLMGSNYGGVYRMLQNPSAIAGSRYKYQVVAGGSSSVNAVYTKFIMKGFFQTLQLPYSDALSTPLRMVGSITNNPKTTSYSEFLGPSFLIDIDGSQTIAVHTRLRSYLYGSSLPGPMTSAYRNQLTYPKLADATGNFDFGLANNSYAEIGLSYGLVVFDGYWHRLKLGATVRRIAGAQLSYLNSRGNYTIHQVAGEEGKRLDVSNLQYDLGTTTPRQNFSLGSMFSSTYGSGWGYDFGATYELGRRTTGKRYNPQTSTKDPRPAYWIRMSAALLNGGGITYPTGQSYAGGGQLAFQQAELEKFGDAPLDYLKAGATSGPKSYEPGKVALPRMLHLEADLRLARSFFLNGLLMQNLMTGPAMRMPNMLVVGPRFEDEDAEFALPISVIGPDNRVAVGMSGRLGPITLGFSDVGRIFNKKADNRSSLAWVGLSIWSWRK